MNQISTITLNSNISGESLELQVGSYRDGLGERSRLTKRLCSLQYRDRIQALLSDEYFGAAECVYPSACVLRKTDDCFTFS